MTAADFISKKNELMMELDTIKSIGWMLSNITPDTTDPNISHIGLTLMMAAERCYQHLGEEK